MLQKPAGSSSQDAWVSSREGGVKIQPESFESLKCCSSGQLARMCGWWGKVECSRCQLAPIARRPGVEQGVGSSLTRKLYFGKLILMFQNIEIVLIFYLLEHPKYFVVFLF